MRPAPRSRRKLLSLASLVVLLGVTGAFLGEEASDGRTASPAAGHHEGATSARPTSRALASRSSAGAQILGQAQVGQTLVAAVGGPKPKKPRRLRFQWVMCDWTGLSCSDLAGATRQRHTVSSSEIGSGRCSIPPIAFASCTGSYDFSASSTDTRRSSFGSGAER